MSLNVIRVFGTICWALVAIDMAIHLLGGNVFVPAAMTIAGVTWIVVRRVQTRVRAVPAGK